jgi:nitrous oxidase accessory protein NosD
MKRLVHLTLLAMAVLLLAAAGRAADRYVSPTGNDATGDGSSGNPWATIQHAINSSAAGDVIYVAAGTYSQQLTINKSLTLRGANWGINPNTGVRGPESVLDFTSVTGSPLISLSTSGKVILDGFKIVDNNATGGRAALAITVVTTHEIRNCIFERIVASGSPSTTRGIEISPSSTGGITIDGNLFKGGGTADLFTNRTWTSAIYSNGGGTATAITNSVFRFCRTAINFDDFTSAQVVTGNTFDQNGTAMSFGGVSPTSGNFTIAGNALIASTSSTHFNLSNVTNAFILDATGNTYDGQSPSAMSLSDLFALEFRMVHRFNVGKNGLVIVKANNVYVVPALFGKKGSIQEGVNAASTGWTVNVAAGTYNGPVLIDKALSLLGPNAGVDPCTASRNAEAVITGTDPNGVLKVAANDVIIDGVKVVPVGTGASGTYGILIQNTQTNLTVRNVFIDGAASDRDGINLWKGTGAHLHHNKIVNAVYGIGGGSDDASNPTSAIIEDNCIENTRLGITGYHDGSTVRRNVVKDFTSSGPAAGISGQLLNTTVTENAVSNYPNGAGIALTAFPPRPHSQNVAIISNTLAGCNAGIYFDASATLIDVEAHLNNISGNVSYGVFNEGSAVFNATCNWWGFATGPTHASNPGGTGDVVSNNVTFTPWATIASPLGCDGSISGTVSVVGGGGLAGVTVKLLDASNAPLDEVLTNSSGDYSFGSLTFGNYKVMLVEPLGFAVDANPKPAAVVNATPVDVDFALTQVVVANNARKHSYWKHQFDVHVKGRGRFDETAAQLTSYISLVHQHYTPHFNIFAGRTTFEDWQDALSKDRDLPPYVDKAMQEIAALVLNLASLKIGQYTVVTDDGRTAGEVLTYVSQLFSDPDAARRDYDKARELAKKVNEQKRIRAGEVPPSSILYKQGEFSWGFGVPSEFALFNNYPNPFNPSTTITYDIPIEGRVVLKVYNSLGQEVATLTDETVRPGRYWVTWDAKGVASGVYLYRLQSGSFSQVRKMVLLK